jgi:signal transduction histidine kinase
VIRRLVAVLVLLIVLAAIGLADLLSSGAARAGVNLHAAPVAIGALAIAVLIVVGMAIVMRATWRAGGPLGSLISAADRVGDGDFSVHVREGGPPFLRSVTRAFNLMTARLREQDEARRQLVADVAHELRTPLTVMQGRVEGLIDGVYAPDEARLREILEEIRVLGRLVEDLRTLANADSGALVLAREPTDIVHLAEDVATTFRAEADATGVTLDVHAPARLPPIDVDPVRLRQVLINLVANALQHTNAGDAISIDASCDDGRMTIRVRDTGSGIPSDDLPRIFDRFYKGDGSRGSGLGLAIARKLVIAHGGDITAASTPGEGTTMTITLPLERRK